MTREEYRAHPALNFSLAKHLLTSPAHFKAAQDEEQEETDAMRIGTLAHAMVLEGKDLRDLYAIKPAGMSFATKEGKAWRDDQTLPILKEEDAESIPAIAEAIAKNPDAAGMLRGCTMREHPIFFTLHGVECKALLDMAGTDSRVWVINDFKTSQDASPRKFAKTAYDMHLDMQAAWYSDGLAMAEGLEDPPLFYWTVTEKKKPFFNVVYQPDDETMANGRKKVEKALKRYQDCMKSGEWPMPTKGVQVLRPPNWAYVESDEEAEALTAPAPEAT